MPEARNQVTVEKRRAADSSDGAPRTAAELRSAMEDVERRLDVHVQSLRKEMSFRDVNVADSPMLDHVRRHPFLAAGIAAGAGVAISLLLSLTTRSRPVVDDKEAWMQAFVSDLLDDAAERIGADGDGDAALRQALRKRAPVIFMEAPESQKQDTGRGPIASILLTVVNTALGFAVNVAMSSVTSEMTRKATESSVRKDD